MAVKVPIEDKFSFKETELVRSPALPESPVISGEISSTSDIFKVTIIDEVLSDWSSAITLTT